MANPIKPYDKIQMQRIIREFTGEYIFENSLLSDGTEYLHGFDETNGYTISCRVSINNVKTVIASATNHNLEVAVCTAFMNASGYTGEFSLVDVQKIIDSDINI